MRQSHESPHPTGGRVGRQPIGVSRMLRMCFLQRWFGLADEAVEDAIYGSQAVREFVGFDLLQQAVPDATTLLTMVDATIIAAPPSTKNKAYARDPQMHQTRKSNEWHFGMKAHIGADADSGLVHSLDTPAANDSDVAQAHEVLHGQETDAFFDVGYTGVAKREEILQARAKGEIRSDIQWHVAARRSTIQKMAEGPLKTLTQTLERLKAQVPFRAPLPCRQ